MDCRYYSKRHFDRVTNAGTGNPQPTEAEKRETWRELALDHLTNRDVVEACG